MSHAFDDMLQEFDFILAQNRIEKLEITLPSDTTGENEIPRRHLDEVVEFILEDMEQLKPVTINCDYNESNLSIKPSQKLRDCTLHKTLAVFSR